MPNATLINLNDTNPAATLGCADVAWQKGNVYSTTVNVNGQTITVDAANVSAQIRNLGGVDPRTSTAETIALASQGKLVTITNASAVTVTLNSAAVSASFYCAVEDLGAGTATLTPTSGTINGAATLDVVTGTGGWLFFDGANWKAVIGGGGTGTFTAGGDLSGNATSQTVIGVQGRSVSNTAPNTSQVLTWGGASWAPANAAAGSGTVTSVAITGDGTVFKSNVNGSPVTTSGTFLPALEEQAANTLLIGPSSGANAKPTFRTMVAADLFGHALLSASHSDTANAAAQRGDVIVGNASNVWARLAKGAANQVLSMDGTGTDVQWANAAAGGVTSVGLSAEPGWFTVNGSPVTTSGTLALNLTSGQPANQVVATPDNATGKAGLRALVGRDLPIGIRADVALDAGTIAAGAGATGSVALGKSSLLYLIVAAFKCRLRLYSTAASRDDAGEVARAWGVIPGQSIDLLLDITWGGVAPQTYPVNPKAVLENKDGSVTTAIYYNVTSREIASQHFTFTLTRLLLEN